MLVTSISTDKRISRNVSENLGKSADYFLLSLLDQFLNLPSIQKFDKQSKLKLPTSMSCCICLSTTNSHKSAPFWSFDSLIRHVNAKHQIEPSLDNRLKDEYFKSIKFWSVILDLLHQSLGDEYALEDDMKILLETTQKRWIK